jgi:hypothetical protein
MAKGTGCICTWQMLECGKHATRRNSVAQKGYAQWEKEGIQPAEQTDQGRRGNEGGSHIQRAPFQVQRRRQELPKFANPKFANCQGAGRTWTHVESRILSFIISFLLVCLSVFHFLRGSWPGLGLVHHVVLTASHGSEGECKSRPGSHCYFLIEDFDTGMFKYLGWCLPCFYPFLFAGVQTCGHGGSRGETAPSGTHRIHCPCPLVRVDAKPNHARHSSQHRRQPGLQFPALRIARRQP